MRPRTIVRVGVLLLSAIGALNASAQTKVSEKRPAAADGVIGIDVIAGTVDVKGWANNELQVTGTVTPADAQLKVTGDPRNLQVTLAPEQGRQASANLEIQVPAGCTVRIKGVTTAVRASGITGSVTAESVEGDITVSHTAEAELQTVKGRIDLTGSSKRARARAVSGSITVKSSTGEVNASSVGGPIVVSGDKFDRLRLTTVSGEASFEGALRAAATLNAESVSGTIKVVLAGGTGADVALSTMSGKIDSQIDNADTLERTHGPKQRVAFSTGGGGAKIAIQTLSGTIVLSKR